MTVARLKWFTILVPVVLMAVFQIVRHVIFSPGQLEPLLDGLLTTFVVLVGAVLLSHFVFQALDRATRSLVEREDEARAIYEVGTEISALLKLDEILISVVEKARELLHTEVAAISLVDEDSREIYMKATSGVHTEAFKRIRLLPGQGLAGRVIETGKPFSVADYLDDSDLVHTPELDAVVGEEGLRSLLAVPLRVGQDILGALYVARRAVYAFQPAEVHVLSQLGTQAAIAIANAKLYDRAQHLAVLEERDRLAREMHDGLAQTLAHLNIRIQSLKELMAAGRVQEAASQLTRMELLIDDAYSEVRQSILGLRASRDLGSGLVPRLGEYLHRWSEEDGLKADLVVSGSGQPELSPAVEVQLVRIIQEALANVRRHAGASRASVVFDVDGSFVRVTVQDDGRGFDLSQVAKLGGRHFGLQTMRERAEGVGGKLEVCSSPGQGTRVVVDLPLKK